MAKYTLDIRSSGCCFRTEGFRTGDNGIRTLEFSLTDGGNALSLPDDCIATLFARLPDGGTIYEPCTVSGDTVIYKLKGGTATPSLTCANGTVQCEVRITTSSGEILTSPRFSFEVEGVLQNDSAIEAQSSFSALTDALGRVLEAESGLDSKADKVEGTPGNVMVFGNGGAIVDSGAAPCKFYLLFYDTGGSHDEENRRVLESIVADQANGIYFPIFMNWEDGIYSAVNYLFGTTAEFYSIIEDGSGALSLKIYDDRIEYSQSKFINDGAFSELSSEAASQRSTAAWVKSYVSSALLIDTEVIL